MKGNFPPSEALREAHWYEFLLSSPRPNYLIIIFLVEIKEVSSSLLLQLASAKCMRYQIVHMTLNHELEHYLYY